MKKYGLQLRVQPQQKQNLTKPSLPAHIGFGGDDEVDVEKEISRQATKKKSMKDAEDQHKKALEEDPLAFDYDGVYDEMKQKEVLPRVQDRQERKPRYIQSLIEKAKLREQEQEIVYERKLTKERSVEDHLYGDKEKFVTGAYKKKLAERAKWLEEERLRQIREEKEDVTKRHDMSDFYFHLSKNVAFGASTSMGVKKQEKEATTRSSALLTMDSKLLPLEDGDDGNEACGRLLKGSPSPAAMDSDKTEEKSEGEGAGDPALAGRHKRSEDQVAAAKERFLARKRAKQL